MARAEATTKYRFRLMSGSHAEGVGDSMHIYRAKERGNNIIDTDVDLAKKFNCPGTNDKFLRIGGTAPTKGRVSQVDDDPGEAEDREEAERLARPFEKWSISELLEHCELEGIEVPSKASKKAVIAAIHKFEEEEAETAPAGVDDDA